MGSLIKLIAVMLPFISPFFCLFKVNLYHMSDCIMRLRLRVMALPVLFLSIFLSFPICMFTLTIGVRVFSDSIKLEPWNLVYIRMMSCGMD